MSRSLCTRIGIVAIGLWAWQAGNASGAWSDCPSPFDGEDCLVPGEMGLICEWVSANNQIECILSDNADELHVVNESSNPWAYGYYNGTEFCCDSTELVYTGVHVYIEGRSGIDIICLHDQDNTSNGCDEYASGDQNWDGTSEIYGGADMDHIDGAMSGDYSDYVEGGTGPDRIYTHGGDDEIYAGPGDDVVWAGDGNDTVYGDNDDDTIYGGEGDDVLRGGEGDDYVYGNEDNDTISGDSDDDYLYGGPGRDIACGDAGRDHVYGDDDPYDCVCGGNGTNNADGDIDSLYGGLPAYNDTCLGEVGDWYDTSSCETITNGACTCGC